LSFLPKETEQRIRAEQLLCKYLSVYLMTNAYAQGDQYFNQLSTEFPYPSDYFPDITATANELLKRIYRSNYKYRKVMISLTGPENTPPSIRSIQQSLQSSQTQRLLNANL